MALAYLPQPRSLIVPRRGFRKPARPVLDPSDPINHGCTSCWPLLAYSVLAGSIEYDIGPNGYSAVMSTGTGTAPVSSSSHHGGLAVKTATLNRTYTSSANALDNFGKTGATITAWGNFVSSGGSGRIIGKRPSGAAGRWIFDITTSNSLEFFKGGTTSLDVISSNNTLSYNVWHFVSVTWDGSVTATNVHLYIDAVEPSYATQTNGVTLGSDVGLTLTLLNAGGSSGTVGNFDCIRTWSRVLSLTEIRRLYVEPYAGILEAGPRWRKGSVAAFNPGWATGATQFIGGVFR